MSNNSTILIVHCLKENVASISDALSEKHKIVFAENGREAINHLQKYSKNISAILVDRDLPNYNVVEILKLTTASDYSTIPVIIMTNDEKEPLEELKNGAADFIRFPSSSTAIRLRVDNAVAHFSLKKDLYATSSPENTKLEVDNLINSIPGGIVVYKFTNHFETLYFSDGIPKLSGHTREEYADYIKGDSSKIIYNEDKKRAYDESVKALTNEEPIDITYRIHHKNGELVWVRLTAIAISKEDDGYIIHAVFQRPERMTKLYEGLVNESSSAIYVTDTSNYELLYINKKALEFIGQKDTFRAGQKCYEYFFNKTSPCKFCKLSSMQHNSFQERHFTFPTLNKIYHLRGKLINWNGIEAHVEYIEDVTKSKVAEQKNAELSEQLSSVIEHVPGGMCLYEANKNGIKPIVHNRAFFEIFGYSKEHSESVLKKNKLFKCAS